MITINSSCWLCNCSFKSSQALDSSTPHSPDPADQFRQNFAALTIQTHFRAFRMRKSCILRQLEGLACIKHELDDHYASLLDKSLFNYKVLSDKAMDLDDKIKKIKCDDPLIQEEKKLLSRKLEEFVSDLNGIKCGKEFKAPEAPTIEKISFDDMIMLNFHASAAKEIMVVPLRVDYMKHITF